ncbi:MAG: dicarboxylate/amino acid:cation symporter [Bacteroidetes bacterium]|nr:dicarboxylate/amino acid:cation symporter [Bacteroidota bacterium]
MKLLKLIAVPLIFISLVKGVTSVTYIIKLLRIGIKAISFYLASTVIAITIGLLVVNALKQGGTFPAEKRKEMQAQYEQTLKEKELQAADVKDRSPLYIVVEMVSDNVFLAMSNNTRMLQVIFIVFFYWDY